MYMADLSCKQEVIYEYLVLTHSLLFCDQMKLWLYLW